MLISFICLSYNQNKEILKLLDSIDNIKNCEYEIILVDDGSNDNTIYECIKLNIGNLRIIQSYKNTKNQSMNRNIGIKFSCGTHIFFIDGDDILLSSNFDYLFSYIQNKNIINDIYFVTAQHQMTDNTIYDTKIVFRDDLELSHAICQYIVYKKYLIKNNIFFEENVYNYNSEDCYFFYLMLSKTNNYIFFNKYSPIVYIIHRINSNTHSKFNNPNYSEYLYKLCNDIRRILIKNDKEFLVGFVNNYFYKESVRIIEYKKFNKIPI